MSIQALCPLFVGRGLAFKLLSQEQALIDLDWDCFFDRVQLFGDVTRDLALGLLNLPHQLLILVEQLTKGQLLWRAPLEARTFTHELFELPRNVLGYIDEPEQLPALLVPLDHSKGQPLHGLLLRLGIAHKLEFIELVKIGRGHP